MSDTMSVKLSAIIDTHNVGSSMRTFSDWSRTSRSSDVFSLYDEARLKKRWKAFAEEGATSF